MLGTKVLFAQDHPPKNDSTDHHVWRLWGPGSLDFPSRARARAEHHPRASAPERLKLAPSGVGTSISGTAWRLVGRRG